MIATGTGARARAFAREFLIIVAGVLVALAAQAWWEGRGERMRERTYLAQLLEDTRENQRRLQKAIAEDSVASEMTVRLLAALSAPQPIRADSFLEWMSYAGRGSDFQPVIGTYSALLGTGDLRLIQTDSLRGLITAYGGTIDSERRRLDQLRSVVLDAVPQLARALPFMRGIFSGPVDPEQVEVDALRRNPEVPVIVFTLQAATYNRLSGLRRARDANARLLSALDAER